jgi:HD-GYP domain-containing protein (c-di-GMP phosphodiesterase class II)
MKKHPDAGAKMVVCIYFKNLSTIIAQHHKRLEGKEY